ncbi:MAG: EAL domain-containing protein [Micromonosporaceae bacterium]|nr:EAL domain-containing protein [Micromonosporaceae bacterium]
MAGITAALVTALIAAVVASVIWAAGRERMKARMKAAILDQSQRMGQVGSWSLDLPSRRVTWSSQLFTLLGYDPATVRPSLDTLVARIHPDDRVDPVAAVRASPETWMPAKRRCRVQLDSGETRIMRSEVTVARTTRGKPTQLLGTFRDITELHQLRQQTTELCAAVETTPDAVISVTPHGVVTSWNPAAERMFGYEADEVIGTSGTTLLPAPLLARSTSWWDRIGEELDEIKSIEGLEAVIVHKDGDHVPVSLTMTPVLDHDGVFSGGAIIARDITQRRQLEDQLTRQAKTDPLTHLANRDLLLEHLQTTIRRQRRFGESVALLFIDLDDFKFVNDTLGHYAGDRLLMAVAGRLRACARSTDKVARLGGDEFAIVLPSVTEEGARQFADRIVTALRPGVDLGGTVASARASIGVALHKDGDDDDPGILLRKADLAMYAAKGEDKGGYRVFADEIQSSFTLRVELEADLRRALASDQFHLHYQPIVALRSGRISGFEALLRWNRPDQRRFGPDQFIPILESTGLITEVGELVLRKACAQAAVWQAGIGTSFSINVNVSPPQLSAPSFVDQVRYALDRAGLPPSSLQLEITEGVMVADVDQVVAKLQQLRELGVRMAIDDFGTGYSSLRYLQDLPVDTVKIDRSFIAKIPGDLEQAALARAIVEIGHALNLVVVAEGVETAEQVQLLRTIGCEYGQGFYFARPQDAQMTTAMLENSPLLESGISRQSRWRSGTLDLSHHQA